MKIFQLIFLLVLISVDACAELMDKLKIVVI